MITYLAPMNVTPVLASVFALLEDVTEKLSPRELSFVEEIEEKLARWGCTEPQLQWLRDLVSRYVT